MAAGTVVEDDATESIRCDWMASLYTLGAVDGGQQFHDLPGVGHQTRLICRLGESSGLLDDALDANSENGLVRGSSSQPSFRAGETGRLLFCPGRVRRKFCVR